MRAITVRVDDSLLLRVKQRSLADGESLTEVVRVLLEGYVAGALVERGQGQEQPPGAPLAVSPRSASAPSSPEPPAGETTPETIAARFKEDRHLKVDPVTGVCRHEEFHQAGFRCVTCEEVPE